MQKNTPHTHTHRNKNLAKIITILFCISSFMPSALQSGSQRGQATNSFKKKQQPVSPQKEQVAFLCAQKSGVMSKCSCPQAHGSQEQAGSRRQAGGSVPPAAGPGVRSRDTPSLTGPPKKRSRGAGPLYFAPLQQQQQNNATDANCHVPPTPSVPRCAPLVPQINPSHIS